MIWLTCRHSMICILPRENWYTRNTNRDAIGAEKGFSSLSSLSSHHWAPFPPCAVVACICLIFPRMEYELCSLSWIPLAVPGEWYIASSPLCPSIPLWGDCCNMLPNLSGRHLSLYWGCEKGGGGATAFCSISEGWLSRCCLALEESCIWWSNPPFVNAWRFSLCRLL